MSLRADHFAHGALGGLLERLVGIAHAEQKLLRIGDLYCTLKSTSTMFSSLVSMRT